MTATEKTLSVYDFGARLLSAHDLDPVYEVLFRANWQGEKLVKWLLAYLCFYHAGTASAIAEEEGEKEYFARLLFAAEGKEYPRGRERRHFRGQHAIRSAIYLQHRGLEFLFAPFDKPMTVKEVMTVVQSWFGFGPWVAFKAADMLERLGVIPVDFSDAGDILYESPARGAADLWAEESGSLAPLDQASRWALDRVVETMEVYKAPPRYERPLNVQEAETILCKWHAYRNGKYAIGEDVEGLRKALLRFARCSLAQELLKAGKGILW